MPASHKLQVTLLSITNEAILLELRRSTFLTELGCDFTQTGPSAESCRRELAGKILLGRRKRRQTHKRYRILTRTFGAHQNSTHLWRIYTQFHTNTTNKINTKTRANRANILKGRSRNAEVERNFRDEKHEQK
jgi:hypothetical protein